MVQSYFLLLLDKLIMVIVILWKPWWQNSPQCSEAPPSTLSLPFHLSLNSKPLSIGQHFITVRSTFASWSSTIPTSAFRTVRERSLCTGQHTVRSLALHRLSAVYWYALLCSRVNLLLSFSILTYLTYIVFHFFLLRGCRRRLPLSPCWTGRTMRDGPPCTLQLQMVTRQWWRCWRLMRAVMWRLMITSSERLCTGQLCSVGDRRCYLLQSKLQQHTDLSDFRLRGNYVHLSPQKKFSLNTG